MQRGQGKRTVSTSTTPEVSKNRPQLPQVTAKRSVKRLMRRDPADASTQPISDQFTNNPNPAYNPSRGNNAAKIVKVPAAPKRQTAGHMKTIMRPLRSWRWR